MAQAALAPFWFVTLHPLDTSDHSVLLKWQNAPSPARSGLYHLAQVRSLTPNQQGSRLSISTNARISVPKAPATKIGGAIRGSDELSGGEVTPQRGCLARRSAHPFCGRRPEYRAAIPGELLNDEVRLQRGRLSRRFADCLSLDRRCPLDDDFTRSVSRFEASFQGHHHSHKSRH